MKLKIALLFLFFTVNCAFGQDSNKYLFDLSSKTCRDVYNSSYQKLSNHVTEFNNGIIKKGAFISYVLAIDTFITSKRLLCVMVEARTNKKCIKIYKKRYKVLRDEIQISAILLENQIEIDRNIIETIRNEFNTINMSFKCGDFK